LQDGGIHGRKNEGETGFRWFETGSGAAFCGHSNESFGSTETGTRQITTNFSKMRHEFIALE
jgi:hypothetical protein